MGQTVGICHRYPPTYAIGCNALIPVVYWCGEWKRKKESGQFKEKTGNVQNVIQDRIRQSGLR